MSNALSVAINGTPIAVTVSGANVPTAQLSVPSHTMATVSGIGVVGSLADISDVQLSGVSAGDVLRYSSQGKWTNFPEDDLLDAGNF